ATRLPPEYRLTALEAAQLLESEVFGRISVHDLAASQRAAFLRAASRDGITGGRIYDAHIAEVAHAAGAAVVVTDNRRHFLTALKHGLRVETPAEFVAAFKPRRS